MRVVTRLDTRTALSVTRHTRSLLSHFLTPYSLIFKRRNVIRPSPRRTPKTKKSVGSAHAATASLQTHAWHLAPTATPTVHMMTFPRSQPQALWDMSPPVAFGFHRKASPSRHGMGSASHHSRVSHSGCSSCQRGSPSSSHARIHTTIRLPPPCTSGRRRARSRGRT